MAEIKKRRQGKYLYKNCSVNQGSTPSLANEKLFQFSEFWLYWFVCALICSDNRRK